MINLNITNLNFESGASIPNNLDNLFLRNLSLPATDYFKLDETSGTVAKNSVPGRSNGSYVGSPTLAQTGDIFGETNGGNSVRLANAGANQYIDLGNVSKEWTKTIATGRTFLFNFQDTGNTGAFQSGVLSVNESTGRGFSILTWGDGFVATVIIKMIDASGNVCSNTFSFMINNGGNTEFVRQKVWLQVYLKAPTTIECHIDGYTCVASASSGSASGSFAGDTVNSVFAGVQQFNGAAGSGGHFYYFFDGWIQRIVTFSGKLTEADRLAYMRKTTRTDLTGKLYRVAECFSPRTSTHMTITNGQNFPPTVDGDFIGFIPDSTGNANIAVATGNADPTLDTRGTYTLDSPYVELDLDNSYQNSGDSSQRRQAYVISGSTDIFAHYATICGVCRPANDEFLGITGQTLASVAGSKFALMLHVSHRWSIYNGTSVFSPGAGFPDARVMPGLAIAAAVNGWSQSSSGKARMFSNGSFANTSASVLTGAYYNNNGTTGNIGGTTASYGDLFGGRIQDIVICNAPILDTALTDWYNAVLVLNSLSNHASKHVFLAGDSITSQNHATRNRGWQSYLPKTYSYTNPSRGGDKISNGDSLLNQDGADWFDLSATKNVAVFMLGTNNILSSTVTIVDTIADYATWRTDLLSYAPSAYILASNMHTDPTLGYCNMSFTGAFAGGETSGTLSQAWPFATGSYLMLFIHSGSVVVTKTVTLTLNTAGTVSWSGALPSACDALVRITNLDTTLTTIGWKYYASTLVGLGLADQNWSVPSGVPTVDGIHWTTPGHATVGASGVVAVALIP